MPFPTLPAPLARALSERGYADPTPVQAAVLEAAAGARDLLVSAQTGSGKTVAYGLAMANMLIGPEAGEAEMLPPPGAPLALVIAPTRELALQVQRELLWLYAPAGGRVTACVGGMDPRREARMMADGTHIVVGTPGRLRDHLERRNLDPTNLRAVVLDEADEMLDLGFREDIEFILSATPPERATYLFSATLPKAIEALAERYQRNALRLAIKGESKGHADIAYRAVRIMPRETEHVVLNLLREADAPTAIVFCNTATPCAIFRRASPSAASRWWRSRASSARASATPPCRRSGTAGPGSASPRTSLPAASTSLAQPRDPRRPAARCRGAPAPQRTHRPRRPQGHLGAPDPEF